MQRNIEIKTLNVLENMTGNELICPTVKRLHEKSAHGDRVMADALTIEDSEIPKSKPMGKPECPENSFGGRMERHLNKRKPDKSWKTRFDFTKVA